MDGLTALALVATGAILVIILRRPPLPPPPVVVTVPVIQQPVSNSGCLGLIVLALLVLAVFGIILPM
jgi:hypothetical protein